MRAQQVRAARSFLFVPGDRPERYDTAVAAGADVVVVDLEDAVAPEKRSGARESLVAWLAGRAASGGADDGGTAAGDAIAVRINAVGATEHEADLEALPRVPAGALAAVVVAKAQDPAALSALAGRLGVAVVALVETAVGALRAVDLAAAPGVERLAFGHLDHAADLGAEPTREAMLHTRSHLVLASRAAGLPGPVDGVTTVLDDPDALADDLAHARGLGFTGKLLIHPRQVAGTHAAYRPSEGDVTWAQRVLAAVAEGGTGAVRVDGEMVDPPVVRRAEDVLRRKER